MRSGDCFGVGAALKAAGLAVHVFGDIGFEGAVVVGFCGLHRARCVGGDGFGAHVFGDVLSPVVSSERWRKYRVPRRLQALSSISSNYYLLHFALVGIVTAKASASVSRFSGAGRFFFAQ